MFRVIDALEDSDDVQNVFANGDVTDEVLAELDEDEDRPSRTATSGPPARRRGSAASRVGSVPNTCSVQRPDTAPRGSSVPRVLGVDPGLTRCGIGVVEGVARPPADAWSPSASSAPAPRPRPRSGCSPSRPRSTPWVDRHRPDAVAIERVFADANVASVMGTAQASAVAMLAAARRGIPVHLHTPPRSRPR